MKPIIITQDDYGIDISCQFLENKLPKNITGKTVQVDIVFPDSTVKVYTATITDAVNGIADLVITKEMTAQAGDYSMFYKLMGDNSLVTSQNVIPYTVNPLDGLIPATP